MKKRLIATLCSLTLAIGLMPSLALADSYWPDPNPPRFVSGSVDKPVATVGDTVTVSYDIADAEGVASVSPMVSMTDPRDEKPDDGAMGGWSASSRDTSSTWRFDVNSSTPPGKRWVVALGVADKGGWVSTIYDATYAANRGLSGVATADLSALTFEVVGPSSIPSYIAIEGNTSSFTQGSSEDLTFRFDAPADKLCSVEIDGERISPDCYTVRAGSTILTLKPAFLNTLDLGDHVVTAFYTDGGRATASFVVSKKASAQEESKQKANDEKKTSDTEKHDEAVNNGSNEPSTLAPTSDSTLPIAGLSASIAILAAAAAIYSMRRLAPDRSRK